MFKKIMVALMAVAVFAIPVGASASSTDYTPYSDFTGVVVMQDATGLNKLSYKTTNGSPVKAYIHSSSGTLFLKASDGTGISVARQWYNGTSWVYDNTYSKSSGDILLGSSITSFKYSTVTIKNDSYDGGNFFTAPPPPPAPVKLIAVKSVQEIVPQTATVAGGIVLAVSIILGVWLLVGLVKRLTYSFLR